MTDLLYVGLTIVVFAVMILLVAVTVIRGFTRSRTGRLGTVIDTLDLLVLLADRVTATARPPAKPVSGQSAE
jgi:hypothetical protein